ncbi:cytochrome P450 [Winogradskyella sp. 3972H.M.0a.05]|uniref:cytochrome P450 n=1 Tax=Winogradskyella sp. 3972H.M.0a.05 TaxID=2950277 RepID=UPI003399E441
MQEYKYPYNVSFFRFLRRSSTIAKNPIPFHNQLFKESEGNSFSIKPLFTKHIVMTRDAEMAREILQKKHKHFEKSKLQTHNLGKYIGYGLLTSTGQYWLKQRRLIQPAFHKEKINGLLKIISNTVEEQVSNFPTENLVDLYALMNTLAFEVIAKSLFNFSADKATLSRLQYIIETLQRFIVKEIRQPHKKLWYHLSGQMKSSMAMVKESRDIINTIIEERRASNDFHDDLLDMLLNAKYEDGSSMSNEQLIDEILILFVAGHETTANALTFVLFLLANHKEELGKATEEAKKFHLETLAMQSFTELTYIKQCIEESMRLYPPAWITDRVNLQDESVGDYYFKEGTMIGVSFYEMHRHKDYWEAPESFRPDRFSEENRKRTASFYMPFGAGPRLCIGNNFAMFEMQLVLQSILSKYTIETDKSTIDVNPLITLKPIGAKLKFVKH